MEQIQPIDNSSDESIKVLVRIRPLPRNDDGHEDQRCLTAASSTELLLDCKPEPRAYTFDHIADEYATQESIFGTIGKTIAESCVQGYNGTIFAYGQTGSGKSYTMNNDSADKASRGLIPRIFDHLFQLTQREQQRRGDRIKFSCTVSYLEIYNEHIFDLLDASSPNLQIREDNVMGVHVQDLTHHEVKTSMEALEVLKAGNLNRRVAETSMNRESSRSHAVLTVTIKSMEETGQITNTKCSRLHLIDLAGSERQKDTKAEGQRLKEAGNINKSLSALSNVIMALVDVAHGKNRHVSYRNSKLTFLLRDSLGGNSKTCIIANVHGSARCFGETLSTLQFAQRAKMIKNKAIINENSEGNVAQLQLEVKRLKELLSQQRSTPVDTRSSLAENTTNVGDLSQQLDLAKVLIGIVESRDCALQEKLQLIQKITLFQEQSEKLEKSLQSTKMLIKMRDAKVLALEKLSKGVLSAQDISQQEIERLMKEILELKKQIEHHPVVTRFAIENLDLREELKRIRECYPNDPNDNVKLVQYSQHALQLEHQIVLLSRHLESLKSEKGGISSINAENIPPTTPSFAQRAKLMSSPSVASPRRKLLENIEMEKFKMEKKLQEEIDSITTELTAAKKELDVVKIQARQREIDLSSSLVANKQYILELESALEAIKLAQSSAVSQSVEQLEAEKTLAQMKQQVMQLHIKIEAVELDSRQKEEELRQALTAANASVSSLSDSLQTAEQQRDEIVVDLQDYQVKVSKLQEMVNTIERREKDADSIFSQQITDLEIEKKTLGNEILRLQTECDRLIGEQETLQDECDTLKSETTFQTSQYELLEHKFNEYKQLIQKMKSSIHSLKEQLSVETEAGAKLKLQLTEHHDEKFVSLMTEIQSLQESLQDIRNQLQESLETSDNLQRILTASQAECETHKTKVEEVQTALLSVSEQLQLSRSEHQDSKQVVSHLCEEISELQSEVSRLEQETENKSSQIQELEQEMQEMQAMHREEEAAQRDEIKAVYAELKSEVESRKAAVKGLEIVEGQIKEERLAKATLQESVTVLEGHLSAKQDEITVLQQRVADVVQEREVSASASESELQSQVQHLTVALEQSQGIQAKLSDLLQAAEESRVQKNSEIAQLKSQISEYSNWKAKEKELIGQLYAVTSSNIDNESKHASVAVQEQQAAKISELEALISALRGEKAVKDSQIKTLTRDNEKLKNNMEQMSFQIELSSTDAQNLVEEIEKTKEMYCEIVNENEGLKSELEHVIEELHRSQEKLAENQSIIETLNAEKFDVTAHHNPKQRIQLHSQLKQDYNAVLQENYKIKLKVAKLEEELERATYHLKPSHSAVNEASKENAKPVHSSSSTVLRASSMIV